MQTVEAIPPPHIPMGKDTVSLGFDETTASWQRCQEQYKLDQCSKNVPDILTSVELHQALDLAESIVAHCREELDSLSAIVRPLGYATLMADLNGVITHVRALDTDAKQFSQNGTRIGGVWSEEREGTNGIGTCLYTRQPVTITRDQHFRSRHRMFSCSGAPIFDWRGRVPMALCLAGCGNKTADRAHTVALAITVAWARIIEERLFREHFREQWIIAIEPTTSGGQGLLLACDKDHRIVGADHQARSRFILDDQTLADGPSLWRSFDRAMATPNWYKSREDTPIHLHYCADASSWHGIATPPAGGLARLSGSITNRLHTRPRLGLLQSLPKTEQLPEFRGGLTPAARRRVLAYIENNLDQRTHVDVLAAQAGLSIYHFTREFTRSIGEAPHAYLLRRRLEKSVEMVENTDQPLAKIALAVGFSDQSHFTRRFVRHVGMTPGAFRRVCDLARE